MPALEESLAGLKDARRQDANEAVVELFFMQLAAHAARLRSSNYPPHR